MAYCYIKKKCSNSPHNNYCKYIQLKIMHPFNYKMAFYLLCIHFKIQLFSRLSLNDCVRIIFYIFILYNIAYHQFLYMSESDWLNVKFYLDFRIFRHNEAMLMRNKVSLFLSVLYNFCYYLWFVCLLFKI